MNNIVLNIRGAHCSGKTTAVRLFTQKHDAEVIEVSTKGFKTALTILKDINVVVLGRYDRNKCGGCDGFKGGDHVKAAIVYAVKNYHPKAIVYEGIMYSITFKMATEIASLSNTLGYEWRSVYLSRSREESVRLLYERNGGKSVNLKLFDDKRRIAETVYLKLASNGMNVKKIDATGKGLEFMGGIVESEIRS